jgi:hypothetical protein
MACWKEYLWCRGGGFEELEFRLASYGLTFGVGDRVEKSNGVGMVVLHVPYVKK